MITRAAREAWLTGLSPTRGAQTGTGSRRTGIKGPKLKIGNLRPGTPERTLETCVQRREAAQGGAAQGVDGGAGADRARALRDRGGGANDRSHAAGDRDAASADRSFSAGERVASSIDELTRTHRREAGIVELEREIARSRRATDPLALAFIDGDGLKRTNDVLGHAAGDQLLRQAADSIRRHLRSHDLIIRFGGDEFLCALVGVTVEEAAKRFSLVNAHLAETEGVSVTVGLTQLQAGDTLEDCIARADEALYRERRQSRSPDA